MAVPSGLPDDVQHQTIQHLDHLNGVINETLRLHPPVPTAIPRLTPSEGVTVGEVFIPGNTTVWCPQYVLGRSKYFRRISHGILLHLSGTLVRCFYADQYNATGEAIYSDASSFEPERWYSRPEKIKEQKAFAPFSTGMLVSNDFSLPMAKADVNGLRSLRLYWPPTCSTQY